MATPGISRSFTFWNLGLGFALFVIPGFQPVHGGQFLYIPYNGTRVNNTQAQDVCRSYGPCELAVIDTQAEYDRMYQYFVRTLGDNFTLPAAFWIGLYWIDTTGFGNYTHFWKKSGQLEELTWSYWYSGEPNGKGYENCARIHTSKYMRTISCHLTYDVLCEGQGRASCLPTKKDECKTFAKCWWTPARVGLTSGFTSLAVFFILCCLGWKYFCAPRAKVGYEHDDDDEDEEVHNYDGKSGVHNILKNHNIDHMPAEPHPRPEGINSVILNKSDNSWMTPEELSFSARYLYKY